MRASAQIGLLAVGLIALALTFRELSAPAAPKYMERVTVGNIATGAPALDKLRRASGSEALTIASPDMGGLLLYSSHLRVGSISNSSATGRWQNSAGRDSAPSCSTRKMPM